MSLFKVVPDELFSILASPNRRLYADALEVLYDVYDENLKIPEERFYSILRERMELQLAEATFDGEDIDEEDKRDISGRARFIIRKLHSKGWIEKERGNDFREYITVPGYSSQLLELFHQLQNDKPARGYSYVFGTYSMLKVASEGTSAYDKMAAVYNAYDNTEHLIKLLQMVYHNVKHYFQIQAEMKEINSVLVSHFDDFGKKIVETYIHPLKIKDSVPKYRVRIQEILTDWLEEDTLTAMAKFAFEDKRKPSLEECREELLQKIFWVRERYDDIENNYLNEIDRQVRRYTRATMQKIENLTNHDHNVRGDLNFLLTALSENRNTSKVTEEIQPALQLYEQTFLSNKSLWYRKQPKERAKPSPVLIQDEEIDSDIVRQAQTLLNSEYGRKAIISSVEKWLGNANVCYSKDLQLKDDKAYIMSLLMMLNGDVSAPYFVKELGGTFSENGYSIPQIQIIRKEE